MPTPNICCCCCSVAWWCSTLCALMDCNMPGFPVPHYLPESAQTHVHWVNDAIPPSHPLPPPSPPAPSLSQYLDLFQWVDSWHQVAKVLELPLQHPSFRWRFRVDWLDLHAWAEIIKSPDEIDSWGAEIYHGGMWPQCVHVSACRHTRSQEMKPQ